MDRVQIRRYRNSLPDFTSARLQLLRHAAPQVALGRKAALRWAMLLGLRIRDFVIVDRLELLFQRGFTVLTGETGAGKSILIDACRWCWVKKPSRAWCGVGQRG